MEAEGAAAAPASKPAAATAAAAAANGNGPVISTADDALYRCDIGERDAIFKKVKDALRADTLDQRHVAKVKIRHAVLSP